jgi:hypothetical protein
MLYIYFKGDHVGLLTFPWSMSVMMKYDKFFLMNCLQCALLANFEIIIPAFFFPLDNFKISLARLEQD